MERFAVALILLLLLICGSVHASELSNADESSIIHEANIALSQRNYSVAFGKYLKLAELGNMVAQFNVGVLYLNGQGVQKNDKQAYSWFGKSAAQGYSRALQIMNKKAAQGNSYAQNELAQLPIQAAAVQDQSKQALVASPDEKVNISSAEGRGSQINVAIPSTTPGKDENGNKDESTVSISFGFDNTSGNYGTKQESTSTSIPAIVSYSTDNYLAALTIPYLEQTGPAGSIAGARRHIIVGGSNKILSAKGLGDILGSVTGFMIDDENTGVSLDVKAQVKFGTANVSNGLGTGKNEYSLEADLYKDFDKLSLSGSLGYTKLESPGRVVVTGVQENIIFHNVFYASVGSTYQISEATKAGMTLSEGQAAEIGMPRQEDITVDFNHKINKTKKLNVYLLKGLANGSPDRGFGASLKSSF